MTDTQMFHIYEKGNNKPVKVCMTVDELESYRAKCKPEGKEEELVKKANEEKGCVKPLDNTPKKAIINVVKCEKGDVTRRDNAFDNWMSPSKNEYILINRKWIYLAGALFLAMIIVLLYKIKKL